MEEVAERQRQRRIIIAARRRAFYNARRREQGLPPVKYPYTGVVPRSLLKQVGKPVDPEDYSNPESDVRSSP